MHENRAGHKIVVPAAIVDGSQRARTASMSWIVPSTRAVFELHGPSSLENSTAGRQDHAPSEMLGEVHFGIGSIGMVKLFPSVP